MNPLYPLVANRAIQRCEYCHAPEGIFNFAFQVEHINPQSRGGSDDAMNLALACNSCNVFKSDAITGWDEEAGEEVRLFHPRNDSWADHFQVDTISAAITGKTPGWPRDHTASADESTASDRCTLTLDGSGLVSLS